MKTLVRSGMHTGYKLVCLWLRSGIPLVTKRYGTKGFGYKTYRKRVRIDLI